ncbi:MAG: CBS domain-containing protein [Cyanobacteria bacterium P01_E01_bin.6]
MLTARDIMTKPVVVIRSTATVENAIWLMRANRVRSLIVETSPDGGCYGIVTEKDIVYKVIVPGNNPAFTRVSSIMCQPCIQIPYSATVQETAKILADSGIHRAPVVDHNTLLGIVSVTDILTKGSLETPTQDELSQHISEALRHSRIINDEETQVKQECDIAWQVLENIRLSSVSQD